MSDTQAEPDTRPLVVDGAVERASVAVPVAVLASIGAGLVHAGVIRLPRLVELMSVNPAAILKVPGGTLAEGAVADITILAPDQQVTIDRHEFVSKSHNTPYHGWTFRGAAAATIIGGRVVHVNAASGLSLAAEGR